MFGWHVVCGCGRLGYDETARDDGGTTVIDAGGIDGTAGADAATVFSPIPGAGVWTVAQSEIQRTLATSVSTSVFTFSTWYKSTDIGTMILNAGSGLTEHTYVWAGTTTGRPFFERHGTSGNFAAAPELTWAYSGVWVHLVLAVDMTQIDSAARVRWWINGVPQVVTSDFPQDLPLHLGDTLPHSLGNKYEGSFPWTGSLAETYIIWGVALDPSAFITIIGPDEVRSIPYTGPITAESAHFDYATDAVGSNGFSGQPDWTDNLVTRSTTDLPY